MRQKDLLTRRTELTQESIRKTFLPQASLNAQATWQSDVPHVPVSPPGSDLPIPNKDQYRATLDVTQLVYDGGAVRNSIDAEKLIALADQQQVEVAINHVKRRPNLAYFTVLLLQYTARQHSLSEQYLFHRHCV